MRTFGRLGVFKVVVVAVTMAALAMVLLPSAGAQKVFEPGPFSLVPIGGSIQIRNTVFDLTPHDQPQCSDGIDNDLDGRVDAADGQCVAPPAGTAGTAADDDSELAPNFQAKQNVSISGTIDEQGNITAPPSTVIFPDAYILITNPLNAGDKALVKATVIPTTAVTGVLNPITGDAALRVRFKVLLQGSVFGVGLGSSCTIGTAAAPIDMVLGTSPTTPPAPILPIYGAKYSATTGRAVLVNNTFPVPGATGCPIGLINVNQAINNSIAIPSPVGSNTAQIEGRVVPVIAAGVSAKLDISSKLGTAPFTVNLDASRSTVKKGPATYAWRFSDGTTDSGISVSHTFTHHRYTNVVVLDVTDADGDTSSASTTVTVNPGTPPPTTTTTTTTSTLPPPTTTTTTTSTLPPPTTTTTTTSTLPPPTTTTTTTSTLPPPTTTTTTTSTLPPPTTTTTTSTLPPTDDHDDDDVHASAADDHHDDDHGSAARHP